ncbi:MAG: hypothetical protein JRD89_16660 [Deltaproteobacteria bacterium]|nr:hypothetical protein [Deltaproteobacteria bacterium]
MIEKIRKQVPFEEFDYQTLMTCLKDYARPRDKISALIRKGHIIRVKKGLYVFGDDFRRSPLSRELLANLIYGPSCVSLDYALHYYGFIPERVEAVTSVTSGRAKRFSSPFGLFIYSRIPLAAYQLDIDRVSLDDGRSFLIATPEKAIADKIAHSRGTGLATQREMEVYLLDNLRIDSETLTPLDPDRIDRIAQACRSRKIRLLAGVIRRLKRNKRGNTHA